MLAEQANIPADRQRIIYSGRVLKDPETIGSYKIKTGQTVHLIRGAAPKSQPASSGASANTTSGASLTTPDTSSTTTTTNSNTTNSARSTSATSNVPTSFATGGTVGNPLADLTGARYAGYANLPSASMFPSEGAMNGIDDLSSLLSQPELRSQLNEMLSNPAMVDMLINANPQLQSMGPVVRQMLSNPEFRSMMTDPQSLRFMSQMQQMMNPGTANSFPAPGPTDDSEETTASTNSNSTAANAQAAGATAGANTSGLGGASPFANPYGLDLLNMLSGRSREGAGAGAGLGAGMPNMESYQQMMNSLMGSNFPIPEQQQDTDTRPPEERYESQLRQLNELGFYDFDRNVRALRRSGGNVQGAIEALLDNMV